MLLVSVYYCLQNASRRLVQCSKDCPLVLLSEALQQLQLLGLRNPELCTEVRPPIPSRNHCLKRGHTEPLLLTLPVMLRWVVLK